ncbi:MAG TPA: FAD-dependent oxidoreductase [Vicinamibacterales bacterium]|nr:FAD-dependent oxidoreductase [Vicinamibacterales bacterium]
MPAYWDTSGALRPFPKLTRDSRADVVVIGGGITGITTAFLLKRAGKTVVLLERGKLVTGDTACTTAHLTCVTDTRLSQLVKSFGADHARAVWDAGLAAIAQVADLVASEQIDCGFAWVPGYLHLRGPQPPADADVQDLRAEAEQAADLGFDAEFVERAPLVDRPAVEIRDQARFHPRQYLSVLIQAIEGDGCAIYEHASADTVETDPLAVVVGDHRVHCDDVVVATHNPIVGKAGLIGATLLQTKLALYTSYAVAGKTPPGAIPDALYWDTGDPYRYLRIDRRKGFDVVILGGEDHKTGQVEDTSAQFDALTAALREIAPDVEVSWKWSGQVIETNDGLPFIGEMAAHQFAATGFSGNGMTFGTLAAIMARDALTGVENPWRELFEPGRTKIRGGLWDYLKENKDYPYYIIRDRFAGADGKSTRAVPRGSGKILELDGKRVAAYRHPNGSLSLRSAVCTHMGCMVGWNDAESTWDCPCHGSRFSKTGDVIAGPAEAPLATLDE